MKQQQAQKNIESQPYDCRVFANATDAEMEAARLIKSFVTSSTKPVLGLATGRTMLPVYQWLRQWHALGELSFAQCVSFNLDEYCGLDADDPSSFASYMRTNFFDHIDMPSGHWHLPDAAATSGTPHTYDDLIHTNGGIGLQLLGIGRNGHIGFNEPGAEQNTRTHEVALTASTRAANAADFPEGTAVPTHAITMGISTILEAGNIVLLATGQGKAEALHQAFNGLVSAACPASYLQLHTNVTVICDEAAAQFLKVHS